VTDLTEGAVARRVPALTDERLRVLSRRQPVTVLPGTSLAECLRAIQRTGTGDSVFVCEPDGRLVGVLTERDIFGRIVVGNVDLTLPVESLMTREPRTLDLDQTIRDLSRGLGITFVVVTHELQSIYAIADRCIMLDARTKTMIAEGKPADLRDHSTDPYVRQFFLRQAEPAADAGRGGSRTS